MSSDINFNLINEEFINPALSEINRMRKDLETSVKKNSDTEAPDDILYRNIERAERLLDKLEEKVFEGEGKGTARMLEVAGLLINSITTATTSIAGNYRDENELQYKLQLLEIKNKELEIKNIIARKDIKPVGNTTNNLIVTDREQLMKLIYENKQIENKQITNEI
jgi:hypothetical protein